MNWESFGFAFAVAWQFEFTSFLTFNLRMAEISAQND